jgi:hypothetical protein
MDRKTTILAVLLSLLFFSNCGNNHRSHKVMPAGEYTFACATGLVSGDTTLHGWSKINQFKNSLLIFQVRNDTLIEISNNNTVASKKTLTRVTQLPDSTEYQKLPKRYLDFELQGIYHEKGHPFEFYSILYYSKQRHALMRQYHSGLNNIDVVALFFSNVTDTLNPFKNYSQFFKLGTLDFHERATLEIGKQNKN